MASYLGLTWDHPRGRDPLIAAAKAGGIDLSWDVQPLSGFESTPIAALAEQYDLIVIDHPHLGDAMPYLRPVDELLSGEFVGPSVASYRMDGRLWALPLDAATQVAATRVDLAGRPPQLWSEVIALSHVAPVTLSLAGPHALLTYLSICVALGEEPDVFTPTATGRRALDVMTDLTSRAPRHCVELDPIGLLDEMVSDDTVAHCPLVYGYVNYASVTLDRRVTFTDAPSEWLGSRPGSTIGGTGLAITNRCDVTPDLRAHLQWLLSATAQESFIPSHSGQPAGLSAWRSDQVNRPVADFYRNTLATISSAWVRPRRPGYIGFQSAASAVIRDVVHGVVSASAGLDRVAALWKGIAS
ncbi:carbohydrate ABC transporter substrate-binding protein [Kribbella jejuensis]|uniref:Carbohydrate ABC transporter substrate-binding protein (CUT1 family) n=1 Tax=Kribbella jejuensis TaxID=236068 RepID=A0A542E972_9ACTN|nr:carbohydrate ABC transporter substrate-binding protein [Kribbella jejuensis]TQJ11863.1 carbohydrate ABC transporter substrate-binding protein (CUT1 family) [Kribbella jejuensis]